MARLVRLLKSTAATAALCAVLLVALAGHGASAIFVDQFQLSNMVSSIDPRISLTTNFTTLEKSGSWVEVSWTGITNATDDDYIALYVPPTALNNLTGEPFWKMKWTKDSISGDYTTGNGSLVFYLLNLRTDMVFVLFRGGEKFPVLTAMSEYITPGNPNEPTQGHLALTDQPGEMTVQWATRDRNAPQVKWGTEPGAYTATAFGRSTTYNKFDVCPGRCSTPGYFFDPGMLHYAVMTNLRPGTRYYYTFGDEKYGWSKEYSFVSAPMVSRKTEVDVILMADMGHQHSDWSNPPRKDQEPASLNTTARMARDIDEKNISLVFHNGDLAYADGLLMDWEVFLEQIEPIATRVPYMTTDGNHERDFLNSYDNPYFNNKGDMGNTTNDSHGECGVVYGRRFIMPTHSEPGPKPLTAERSGRTWYSFDYGPIHFLQYSTESDFGPGSEQYRFIVNDLQSVDRSRTPWLLVGFHRAMYVMDDPEDEYFGFDKYHRSVLEKLFYDHKVDLTFSGHVHNYQRICSVYNEKCVPLRPDGSAAAPTHVVVGHAGRMTSMLPNYTFPDYIVATSLEHGYVRIHVNETYLVAEMVGSNDGSILDAFTLKKADEKPQLLWLLLLLLLVPLGFLVWWAGSEYGCFGAQRDAATAEEYLLVSKEAGFPVVSKGDAVADDMLSEKLLAFKLEELQGKQANV